MFDIPDAIAHSKNADGVAQPLRDHLEAVAEAAAGFGARFRSGGIARAVGLLHDIGKLDPAFQSYLRDCESGDTSKRRGPDHKSAGAAIGEAWGLGLGIMAVLGHHGGLPAKADLKALLARSAAPGASVAVAAASSVGPPEGLSGSPVPRFAGSDRLSAEFWIRMVFSALVDADFLDTERHFAPDRGNQRSSAWDIDELERCFSSDTAAKFAASKGPVDAFRREVLEACWTSADAAPGLFSLAVPTGGGKTRSAMAFALRHCRRWGLERVVVAVPYLSITEQTADVYRSIFEPGDSLARVVLEHHSGLEVSVEESFAPEHVWRRLAAENWDAPIIVTTTVQLFESLFAASTSRCRKLHRLAKSVIVLDEAQALPPHLLTPILDAVSELVTNYGASVVLSTATQPAFDAISSFKGLEAKPIFVASSVPDVVRNRVRFDWRLDTPMEWSGVADLVRTSPQALAIVNTKKDALRLLEELGDPQALHLSTLICGSHRRAVLQLIRRRLQSGQDCRVVSTQVVEAGVDVDFPLVLRALAPLDSIIQSAGRANREGRLAEGLVVIFQPSDGGLPPGAYTQGANLTRALRGEGSGDPADPEVIRDYFRRLFSGIDTDRLQIQSLRKSFDYPAVQERFRMIDHVADQVVIATYGEVDQRRRVRTLLDELRVGKGNLRSAARELQPFMVSIPASSAKRYRSDGLIEEVVEGLGEWLGSYDAVVGIGSGLLDPADLVV